MPVGRKQNVAADPTIQAAPPASGGGIARKRPVGGEAVPPSVRESTDIMAPESGPGMGTAVAGAAGLAGLGALAMKAPGRVGRIAQGLNALRSQFMLAGLAPLKSALGNVGAGVAASIERGTTRPIQEILSRQTLDDAVAAYRRGTPQVNDARQVTLTNPFTGRELPTPGRFMGALDDAAQKALQRAGHTSDEAAAEVLQTPLGTNWGRAGEALDNPVMQYLLPFRRTPFNQLWEGGKAMGRAIAGDKGAQRANAVYGTVGAAHGAATSDDNMPLSVPLAIAAAGRYGVPYALAALAGRTWLGGADDGGGIASNALPVSEYGIEQGITDPFSPFGLGEKGAEGLAPVRALERLSR